MTIVRLFSSKCCLYSNVKQKTILIITATIHFHIKTGFSYPAEQRSCSSRASTSWIEFGTNEKKIEASLCRAFAAIAISIANANAIDQEPRTEPDEKVTWPTQRGKVNIHVDL